MSFGLVVDSAIIMLDHLHRRGNRKIFAALVGATLTSLCALLVVYVLPEEQQLNLREFAQIMMAMLAVSLLVAWFYTPAAYKLLSPKQKSKQKGRRYYQKLKKQVWLWQYYGAFIQFLARYRIAFTTIVVLLFGLPVFMLPASVEGWGWYNSSIGSELYQQKVKPYADVALGGALRPFVQEVYDKASFRTPEKTVLHLHATMPHGATLAQMNEAVRTVEQYLASVAGLEQYVTQVQSGQSATLQITFNPVSERAGLPYTLRSQLIARFMNWGGANWQIYGVGRGFSSGAGGSSTPALLAELCGYNYSELERQAELLAAKLAENARVRDINTNAVALWGEQAIEEYVFQFDNAQLNLTKLNSGEVTEALRARAKPMAPAMYLLYQNELLPVSLRERDAEQLSVYQLLHGSFRQEDGKPGMQIGTLGKLSFEKSANTIHKKDRQYIRNLSFTYFGNYKYGTQFLDDVLAQARREMKPGYTAEATSLFKSVNKEAGKQYGALAVMVLGIFFVCAILFESLRQPFFIMLTVPVSFIGLFLVFSLFGFSFDQGGYAAFILLGGVGVNAAIFIINDLNNLKSTQSSNRAVLKAVTHKALPVCLTVASTVLGLVPFLIDGQQEVFWFSFAVGAIGGFLFSLIAVFVCLPVWLMPRKSR
ncbi:efflux RND transporter permease subunit [Pontibacter sp. BAB1700]|uniref:efflux RND transporter permease subunit n=1 Tax=Pontibacter sp. BAB1700 TaxID=1144253 RepID=UPI0012DE25E5|nr:efflux RND transporter permease subunit [Pontibacter sp. BAB1700]